MTTQQTTATPDATASRVIPATPPAVWEAITDLSSIRERNPETFAARWTRGDGPAVGSRFRGWNRIGVAVWATLCTVTEADAPRVFAFDVTFLGLPGATWRWEIAPEDSGSRVTLSSWNHTSKAVRALGLIGTGVRDRNARNQGNIEQSLQTLETYLADRR